LPAAAALLAALLGAAPAPGTAQPRSGYADMGAATQALQRDDTQNPAFLWVEIGRTAWRTPAGTSGKSCRDCHGALEDGALRGLAARLPAWDARAGRVSALDQRIRACSVERQGRAAPPSWESEELLALEAVIGLQSRGLPIVPDDAPAARAAAARGERLFQRRIGQLDLACAQCHDAAAGRRLGGQTISQGHPSGYPIYRLEWQALGSLKRRLRACMAAVRAEPYAFDAAELLELETYLKRRAAGLPVETPAVRP
jgi:sulfur-oxidizing protein SoxA